MEKKKWWGKVAWTNTKTWHTREKFINHQENILQLCTQHTQYCTLYNMYTAVFSMGSYHRVEWFTTFMRFSKMDTFCRSGIFLWVPFKKTRQILPFTLRASEVFNFQKIRGTLELMFFYYWQISSFCINEHLRKVKIEI